MDIIVPKPVNETMDILYKKNYEGYLVGGTVRNLIMGEKPKQYDVATNATIKEITDVYSAYQTYFTGQNNQVLGIVNPKYPMRIEQYKSEENTLESHLKECDFTMNALAYSEEDGLIDYTTGVLDIRNRILRLNGEDDKNIKKDPILILRAIRLSAEYGMKIDLTTQEYMKENKELLRTCAKERIRDEISKLLVTPRCDFYIKKYFDIIVEVLPELSLLEKFDTKEPTQIYSALDHTLVSLRNIDNDLVLRLTMLFHDIGKPFVMQELEDGTCIYPKNSEKSALIARDILNRLKFKKHVIQNVVKFISYHDYKVATDATKTKEFLSHFGTENIDNLYKIKKANFYAKNPAQVAEMTKIEEEYIRLKASTRKTFFIKRNELKIDGRTLLELGITEENIGPLLNELYIKVLAGELKNNREKLISYVEETKETEFTLKKVA